MSVLLFQPAPATQAQELVAPTASEATPTAIQDTTTTTAPATTPDATSTTTDAQRLLQRLHSCKPLQIQQPPRPNLS